MDNLYVYKFKKNNYVYPNLFVRTDYKYNAVNYILNKADFNNLCNVKNKINKYKNKWNQYKLYTNPFELIYGCNIISIAKYTPLSRSYFKMIEILNKYKWLTYSRKMDILCLAEGPGGFIEALINTRKPKYIDTINAMTLINTNKSKIPQWNQSNNFLEKHQNIKILYGADNTGDLYNVANHKYIMNNVKKADLITADGGFDFSINYNNQEIYIQKLIYAQTICALANQRKGGAFICKLFDSYTYITQQIIFILLSYYEEVEIFKPYTSRPANAEKYIICRNFKGIDKLTIMEMQNVLEQWNKLDGLESVGDSNYINSDSCNYNSDCDNTDEDKNNYDTYTGRCGFRKINSGNNGNKINKGLYVFVSLFPTLPSEFIEEINKINSDLMQIQTYYIIKTIKYIKTNSKTNNNLDKQAEYARNWCKNNNVGY